MNAIIAFIFWVIAGAPANTIPAEFELTEQEFYKMSDEDKESWQNSDAGKYWNTLHNDGQKYFEHGGTVADVIGA